MNQQNTPPAKKKSDFPMTQPINKDVMELVSNKGKPKANPNVEQIKNRLLKVIQTSGADPQKIIQAGKYAEMGLKNPQMYQMALNYALKSGILTQDQMPKEPGIDYKLLANGITAGKLTQELIAEGKL